MNLTHRDLENAQDQTELVHILQECFGSLAKLGKVLFPERFRLRFTKQHYAAFEILDDPEINRVAIAAFRGFGKTSVVGFLLSARNILYRVSRFILYVSKSETHAMLQTENLKRDLLSSQQLREWFGSIKTKNVRDMDETFSKKSWVAMLPSDDVNFKTLVLPRGAGQQVRGLLFDNHRPDLIQVDDLEDDETIGSLQIRQKTKDWFFGPLLQSVQQAEESGVTSRVIYIDTIKHHDSLLVDLLEDPGWVGLRLPVCDENYQTLVPGFISNEKIMSDVEMYRRQQKMDVFAREFMCRPSSKEGNKFSVDYIKYYRESDKAFLDRLPYLRSVVLFDPSRTYSGNKTGLVCWSVDVEGGALYMREARAIAGLPDAVLAEAFSMCQRYGAHMLGYEDTGLNEWISQPIRNEMINRRLNLELIPLKAKRARGADTALLAEEEGKPGRSAPLLNYYRLHDVYHNEVGTGAYELNLLDWPRPKEWDCIDAAAYIIYVMEEYYMFFQKGDGSEDEYTHKGEYDDMETYGNLGMNEAVEHFI